MKVQDLIELINNSKELYCLDTVASIIPNDIKCVAAELNINRHRWFSTAVDVYACEDGYVGILGINDIYDECAEPIDCDFPCTACEYVEVQNPSYQPKN